MAWFGAEIEMMCAKRKDAFLNLSRSNFKKDRKIKDLLGIVLVLIIALRLSFSDVSAEVISQNITAISGWATKDYIKNHLSILLSNIDR